MEFVEVRPGIVTAVLEPEQVNVTVVAGGSRCLLVDTGSSPAQGAEIRETAGRAVGVPLETVVVSHGHWDHAFGLSAFADLNSVGHENLEQDLHCEENVRWATDQQIDLGSLALPTTQLVTIGVRDLGGMTAEIAHFGPAHSRSDLIIAVPQCSTLIVGDLVEEAGPQFDETTCLDGWVKALDALYGLLTESTLVIPGHGAPLGPVEVTRFRAGLAAIWDQSEWAFRQGVPEDQAYDHDELEWPWDRTTVEQGIRLAYAELAVRPEPVQPPLSLW